MTGPGTGSSGGYEPKVTSQQIKGVNPAGGPSAPTQATAKPLQFKQSDPTTGKQSPQPVEPKKSVTASDRVKSGDVGISDAEDARAKAMEARYKGAAGASKPKSTGVSTSGKVTVKELPKVEEKVEDLTDAAIANASSEPEKAAIESASNEAIKSADKFKIDPFNLLEKVLGTVGAGFKGFGGTYSPDSDINMLKSKQKLEQQNKRLENELSKDKYQTVVNIDTGAIKERQINEGDAAVLEAQGKKGRQEGSIAAETAGKTAEAMNDADLKKLRDSAQDLNLSALTRLNDEQLRVVGSTIGLNTSAAISLQNNAQRLSDMSKSQQAAEIVKLKRSKDPALKEQGAELEYLYNIGALDKAQKAAGIASDLLGGVGKAVDGFTPFNEGGQVPGNDEHESVPDSVPTILAPGEVVVPNSMLRKWYKQGKSDTFSRAMRSIMKDRD